MRFGWPGGRNHWLLGREVLSAWWLISSAPLALFTRVAHPPLPRVAPILHATTRLPADQLGSVSVG
ncbi:Uncharacterised protein [Mycobacterium tuberculosis]|uniref:Uncharacterized protein n=1 Tax=Mycobacterium tuberculosis TaxID=1773 RepID=A0A916P820_MYCTX|nr:Uncharacterised protein [Mycobacterium tuberculosis]